MNEEVENELRKSRVDSVHFVDIPKLTNKQGRSLPCTILIGITIDPEPVKDASNNPDYKPVLGDEHVEAENKVGGVTDELVESLASRGYKALLQSDTGLLAEGVSNLETKGSVLPYKTVAQLSGLGWIGRNNPFITPKYGTAQCLGTVLIDAPLETVLYTPVSPKYGNCNICRGICKRKVLKGATRNIVISGDDITDVYRCSTCLKCLAHCPWT